MKTAFVSTALAFLASPAFAHAHLMSASPADKAKVKAALKMYLEAGTLIAVDRMDEEQRKSKKFVEVPDLQRAPSEYVRDHFWFTTQPIEEPESERQFSELWAQFVRAGMRERLMFSSDYPHWDWDAPDAAIPVTVTDEDRDAIFRLNPLSCYSRLEATRSPDRVLRTC